MFRLFLSLLLLSIISAGGNIAYYRPKNCHHYLPTSSYTIDYIRDPIPASYRIIFSIYENLIGFRGCNMKNGIYELTEDDEFWTPEEDWLSTENVC